MLLRLESVQKRPVAWLDGTKCGTVDDFLFDEQYGTVRFVSVAASPEPGSDTLWIGAGALRLRGERLEVGYPSCALRDNADGLPRGLTTRRLHRSSRRDAGTTRLRTPGFALPPAVPRTSLQRSARHASHASQSRSTDVARNVRLRSFRRLRRARILTEDGEVGWLDDFVMGRDDWTLRHLVVALDPGGSDNDETSPERERVLVGLSWVRRIDWGAPSLQVDLPREQLLASPRLESGGVVPHEFERKLYDFHGRR